MQLHVFIVDSPGVLCLGISIRFDEDYVPKPLNFSFSQFIPEGETHLKGAIS